MSKDTPSSGKEELESYQVSAKYKISEKNIFQTNDVVIEEEKSELHQLFPLFLIYGPLLGHSTVWLKFNLSKPINIAAKTVLNFLQSNKIDYTLNHQLWYAYSLSLSLQDSNWKFSY